VDRALQRDLVRAGGFGYDRGPTRSSDSRYSARLGAERILITREWLFRQLVGGKDRTR